MIGIYFLCGMIGLAVILALIALWAYHMAFHHKKSQRDLCQAFQFGPYAPYYQATVDLMAEMKAIPFESVTISSADGLALHGRYYHWQDGAPLQIQFHGYKGHPMRDFCGGHKLARELGFNVLVIDQRAHAKSQGRTITFGILERQDCLAWVNYAVKRFGEACPIYLAGISMGAATVLMATELALPPQVKGIIADCPYSSPKAIICKVSNDVHIPARLSFPFARLGALLYGKFVFRTHISAVNAVKSANIPILLIHGEADDFVPCHMSREIYEACASPKTLVVIPNAPHGMSYLQDPDGYRQAVEDFVTQTK